MPDDPTLTPATPDELTAALSYALRFDERGKAHSRATDMTARIAAETLVRYLDLAGFVVMKRPPAVSPTTPKTRNRNA